MPRVYFGRPWTMDETKTLRLGFELGCSYRKLAQELGRSIESIESRVIRMGLVRKRSWTTEDDSALLKLVADRQMTREAWEAVAESVGRSVDACRVHWYQIRPISRG